MSEILLKITDLKKHFPIHKGLFRTRVGTVKAVDGVSFSVPKGSTFGLVGESGCGKSTLGRTIIKLYEPSAGEILFEGSSYNELKGNDLRLARKRMQMIFQDPFASLDPRMTVGQILAEPFKVHGLEGGSSNLHERTKELLKVVGLKPMHLNRYPHEFSGGQRQRISVARSLALRPSLIIADEPVSALDVSIQAQILGLLQDLQGEFGLTYLFISHDLAVVEHMCDMIAVMYLGKIVELATRDNLFSKPQHPYTQALINAIPVAGRKRNENRKALKGEVPSPINPPSGCAFHPRCPMAMDRCSKEAPPMLGNAEHSSACWLNS
ncbi:MAG: dipeptide ABC transporter ATP-binding protein [Oligoflexales bacterium]|nr:dipeptide ABC transporter ATP-binding protein [Oligoflexales bacterium]